MRIPGVNREMPVVSVLLILVILLLILPASATDLTCSVTGQYADMNLVQGNTVYNSSSADGVNVTIVSDGSWKLTVYDNLTQSKPSGTEGHMAEWDGSSYVSSGGILTSPLQISGDGLSFFSIPARSSPQEIAVGAANIPEGLSIYPVFRQPVAANEHAVGKNDVYRIILTFEATSV
jgi:hypothetical protein